MLFDTSEAGCSPENAVQDARPCGVLRLGMARISCGPCSPLRMKLDASYAAAAAAACFLGDRLARGSFLCARLCSPFAFTITSISSFWAST